MNQENYSTGLRILDIEHGFRQSTASSIEAELSTTLLLGKATNLALHIRGLNVITDYRGLTFAGTELGISATELPTVLRELDEIGWVRLITTGAKIKRVEVLVPTLRDGFEVVGERWRDSQPSEIEQASVAVLAEAVKRPLGEWELEERLGMDAKIAQTALEWGEMGTYLARHRLDKNEKVVYSPLYYEGNPEKALLIAQKYGDPTINKLVSRVRTEQGVPSEHLPDAKLLDDLALAGLILRPGVEEKSFVFTPQLGFAPEETVILDKARAIVSCVRYGEHYAGFSRIIYPSAIIRKLIEVRKLAPHSAHDKQYGPLVLRGIGRIEPVGSRWRFSVNDTEDNMKALRVAKELLETGDAVQHTVDDATQLRLLNPKAAYSSPVTQRVKLREKRMRDPNQERTIAAISDLIRGAQSV